MIDFLAPKLRLGLKTAKLSAVNSGQASTTLEPPFISRLDSALGT
jgi:hypothetical protein